MYHVVIGIKKVYMLRNFYIFVFLRNWGVFYVLCTHAILL